MESIVAVQFKKGNSMLHFKESFLEESYATINFLQPYFLKKGGLKTFPTTRTECCGTTKSKHGNIVHTLKGVPPSAHSFWNSNNTSPHLCCSRDILEEEECYTKTVNETVHCTLGLIIFYLKLHKIHWLYILYLYFMTYFIRTNFTQWQYVIFFNVLIFVQFFTNLCARINFVAQMRENQYALKLVWIRYLKSIPYF